MEIVLTFALILSLVVFTYQLSCYIKYHNAKHPSTSAVRTTELESGCAA